MRILAASEMQAVDRRAIEEVGIPGMVLMENAAIGVVDAIAEYFPQAESVAIFCGPGNNGGDGLAVARHLDARGYRLRSFLVARTSPADGSVLRGDAATQLEILERSGKLVEHLTPKTDLVAAIEAARDCDLIVDALFGTGLSRALEGHYAELVQHLETVSTPVLAVDLPSGLDASRGAIPGAVLPASVTVTFAAPKRAHIFAPASDMVGRVVVTDLGIPSYLVEEAPGALHLLDRGELAACLLPRAAATHKGDFGHTLLIGGSPGKSGAMVLAARAAVRGGAGLVTVGVPAGIMPTVDAGSLESMTISLPSGDLRAALLAATGKRSVAIGPGMGLDEETVRFVGRLVREIESPLVIDADGLNALGESLGDLRARTAETVLTPHPGEMGRLLGVPTAEIQADRLAAARRAAELSDAIVILKGHRTLIADPDGEVYVNPTGNPGMATGGSGDVLTGLLAALLAQGYEALIASQLAVFLHGLAGDLVIESGAPEALAASDLIDAMPRAFDRLRNA